MDFEFVPALGKTLRLSTPTSHATTTELVFTATLSPDDFERFSTSAARFQLWSDLPAAGRSHNEWGETDLAVKEKKPGARRYSLAVTIPIPANYDSSRFSFTYRLVYPSGEVTWLGAYGQNGTLVIDRETSHGFQTLTNSWNASGNDLAWASKEAQGATVAKLANPNDWTVLGVGQNNFLEGTEDCSMLTCHFSSISPIIVYPTMLLVAGPDTTISYDSNRGAFTVNGPGGVKLRTHDSSPASSLRTIGLLGYSSEQLRAVDVTHDHLVIAGPEHSTPVSLAAIPLHSGRTSELAALQVTSLSGLLGDGAAHFALFIPSTTTVAFLPSANHSETFPIFVPPSGARFLVSPIYDISSEYQLSILTPHIRAPSEQPRDGVLPTPPPSPRLVPISHLSRFKTDHNMNESVASISDIGIPSRRETPEPYISESSSVLTVRPSNYQTNTAGRRGDSGSAASLLSSAGSERNKRTLLAFFKYMFMAGWLFVASILRSLLGLNKPALNERRRSDADTSSSAATVMAHTDETTPLLAEVRSAQEPTVPSLTVSHVITEEPAELLSDSESEPIIPEHAQTTAYEVIKSLSFDVVSGKLTFVWKHLDPRGHQLCMELNGKSLESDAKSLGDEGSIVEVETDAGGRLSFNIAHS